MGLRGNVFDIFEISHPDKSGFGMTALFGLSG
jgi:hypothetical protein